jgi:hypothetical protein
MKGMSMTAAERSSTILYSAVFLGFPFLVVDVPMNMTIYIVLSILTILGTSVVFDRKNWKSSSIVALSIAFTIALVITYCQRIKGTPIPGMEYTEEYVATMMWVGAFVCGIAIHALSIMFFAIVAIIEIIKFQLKK